MSLWRQLRRGLRALVQPGAADRDVDDELRDYLERTAAALESRGIAPNEARRAARVELGSLTSAREQVRSAGWEHVVATTTSDARHALRRLGSEAGFTAVTVLTIAIGIGATTAIFSAVTPILLHPLPYPGAERIAAIWETSDQGARSSGTFGAYRAMVEQSRSFEALAVLKAWQPTVVGGAEPERLEGQRVSAAYFRVLGVRPALGQDFQESDDRPGGANVVLLSDALWRRRFGADGNVVGRSIRLDDDPYTVIGVMPRTLENVLAPAAELWTPLKYAVTAGYAWGHHLRTIGRLGPGVTWHQARVDLDALGPELTKRAAASNGFFPGTFELLPLRDDLTRAVKPALLAIAGAVVLLLVIACVNVTNLLLARGAQRKREFAVRSALGAGHRRLMRQLLTESLVLAFLGGVAGMVVAVLGVRALIALSPAALPRLGAIHVDLAVFSFGLGIAAAVGVMVGIVPALHVARAAPHDALQRASRRSVGDHSALRRTLVVAEVALALVLLVGSGLLLRSLQQLFRVEAGFDAAGTLSMQVQTAGHRFDTAGAATQFFTSALERVRQVPGVQFAGLTSQLPFSGDLDEYGVHFESNPTQGAESFSGFRYAVTPGYLEAMRIPLKQGRVIDDRDVSGAPLVALISESLARRRFAGRDPIGQRLRIGPITGEPYVVVGVVGDVKQASLALSETDAVYVPEGQWSFSDHAMTLVIRSSGSASALAGAVRAAIWSVDKDQPIVRVATLDDLVSASAAERRFALVIFSAFALAALVLAAAGIYGVLAGSVVARTREIGVRSALGASRSMLLSLVVREGMTLAGIGAALGVAGAAATTQGLASMLYGIAPLDAITYVGVLVVLGVVATAACAVPAWRATQVDPATTLRSD